MNSSRTDERTVSAAPADAPASEELQIGPMLLALLWRRRLLVVGVPLLASVLTLGGSYFVTPTFTSRITFLPPQPQQGGAAGALASLGALTGLAGGAGIKTNGDQYVSFLQSWTVADRMIERFDLVKRYDRKFKTDARKTLAGNTQISLGKRDGLITLNVDDEDPKVAAAMATAYVEELRTLTAKLALTEAQQRRMFFEKQLQMVRDKLTEAQQVLAATGVSVDALKAEPKATAEGLAKLKAELTSSEIKLQVLRRSMSDNAAEVVAQSAQVAALRAEMAKQGQNEAPSSQKGYIGAYREFKYQETLFDQIARQYEVARIDESRDGGQVQVVDEAQVPERKSHPKRALLMLGAFAAAMLAVVMHARLTLGRELRRPRA
jgi:uncharacterized protein involved in exopolysaccharide biosynthesis